MNVECMCGAKLTVSEASSGGKMLIETHRCGGWEAAKKKLLTGLESSRDAVHSERGTSTPADSD